MSTVECTLFAIIRSALGIEKLTAPVSLRPRQWDMLLRTARMQQVAALAYEELEAAGSDIPEDVGHRWRAHHDFLLKRFDSQLLTLTRLSAVLEAENVRMMVLKGVSLALIYPNPRLRECADIDIFCFDDYKKVNEFIISSGIDDCPHEGPLKEFSFKFGGINVENHGRFTNDSNDANTYINEVLMKMNSESPPLQDPRIPGILIPSVQVGALQLIIHTLSHLTLSGITLRQLCDVTAYLRAYREQIDFKSLRSVLKEAGVEKSAALLIDICSSHLGLGLDITDWKRYGKDTGKTVLHSIFHPFKRPVLTRNPLRKFYRKVVKHRRRSRLYSIVYGEKFPKSFLGSFACLKNLTSP